MRIENSIANCEVYFQQSIAISWRRGAVSTITSLLRVMAKGGRHADSDVVILEKPKPYNIITTLATPAVDEYKSYALTT